MRRTENILTAALLCIGLQVWAQDITTDVDSEYGFSQAQTFGWGKGGSASGDLVWTSTSAGALKGDPDKREAQVRSALASMFSAFPPSD